MAFIKNKLSIYIFLLILIGGFFRFYNLNWGSPFYFHPDERNIASSIVNLQFPNQMNPHFFAYGSFPIYLIYFTAYFSNLITKSQLIFEQAIIIGRFYSAFLSVLLIPSIYYVGTKLVNKRVGILAATFCALSVGLIQFSHFGTFEVWLTFLGLWLFYFSLKLKESISIKNVVTVGIVLGLLVATKVSSLSLSIIPAFSLLLNYFSKKDKKNSPYFIYSRYTGIFAVILCVASVVFFAVSPFTILDFPSFLSSIRYESSVAFGTLPVFYTGEFFNSVPILFQFTKIYPFLLNPILTILFISSFFYLSFKGIKNKNLKYLLLNTCYLILFLPQAFLFAKWTRYIVPTLPFIYLITSIALIDFFSMKKIAYYRCIGILVITIFSFVFAVSYFATSLIQKDTRIQASLWAKENIPTYSSILSEVYDMGIVPFNQYLKDISLFNFYDLDQTPDISQSEYIILPSQRILKTRLVNNDKFPNGYKFYSELIDGKLGYKKIYETSCDIFCKITYLGDPIFSFEETTSVFDRPTVFIFKKI